MGADGSEFRQRHTSVPGGGLGRLDAHECARSILAERGVDERCLVEEPVLGITLGGILLHNRIVGVDTSAEILGHRQRIGGAGDTETYAHLRLALGIDSLHTDYGDILQQFGRECIAVLTGGEFLEFRPVEPVFVDRGTDHMPEGRGVDGATLLAAVSIGPGKHQLHIVFRDGGGHDRRRRTVKPAENRYLGRLAGTVLIRRNHYGERTVAVGSGYRYRHLLPGESSHSGRGTGGRGHGGGQHR